MEGYGFYDEELPLQRPPVMTMRQFLAEQGYTAAASVYDHPSFLDYRINSEFDLTVSPTLRDRDTFHRFWAFRELLQKKQSCAGSVQLSERIDRTKDPEERRLLRLNKRQLDARLWQEAAAELFGRPEPDYLPAVLRMQSLTAFQLEELEGICERCPAMQDKPWFTANLEMLKEMLDSNEPIGIEGGSCLIGCNELHFVLNTADGSEHRFDFTMMERVTDFEHTCAPKVSDELYEFVQTRKNDIVSAWVDCRKNAITSDEREMYTYLFSLAHTLKAHLVVTIPDMAYDKTFRQIFSVLPPTVFEPFYRQFAAVSDTIADINLTWIERLHTQYPVEHLEILHKRNPAAMACFTDHYRQLYEKHSNLHTDRRSYMVDAIREYICMPAMPYYRWGVTNLIEVNNLREAPSMAKCKRLHAGLVRFCSMLYPQKICKNGLTTEFFAANQFKEYVEL